ncbi:MAG: DUF4387 domain-containing protein [Chloroflexi bacterium]|nr:DUF4387 domain-containing protein [Chloroflexota bacterium]
MARLHELARLVRSKNAGPFAVTFDLIFDDPATFESVRDAGVVTPELFARLYGVPEEQVMLVAYAPALAIKATIPRPVASGDLADTDVFGAQLYGPLVELEVPGVAIPPGPRFRGARP